MDLENARSAPDHETFSQFVKQRRANKIENDFLKEGTRHGFPWWATDMAVPTPDITYSEFTTLATLGMSTGNGARKKGKASAGRVINRKQG